MGTPDFAVNVLQGLIDNYRDDIVGVVSQPDKLVGRHQVLTPTPIKECFKEFLICYFYIWLPLSFQQAIIKSSW